MAITFETEAGTIQIGTTSDPFPAYNISAGEKVETGDGTRSEEHTSELQSQG